MPMRIGAVWNQHDVAVVLDATNPKQFRFATALALTRTAQSVRSAERGTMRQVFDQPTPYTLNSLLLQRATTDTLEARVWFRDPPRLTQRTHYLEPQVFGGERPFTRFEAVMRRAGYLPGGRNLVPTEATPRDSFGNVARGLYAKIYADLRASPSGANRGRVSTRARNNRAAIGDRGFFYSTGGRLARGVWQRRFEGVRPIFLETRRVHYRPIFPFFDIAERTNARVFPSAFESAYAQAVRTARR